jgi:uncharacterized membrane protein YgaE (UPF0421/DUF939 family)
MTFDQARDKHNERLERLCRHLTQVAGTKTLLYKDNPALKEVITEIKKTVTTIIRLNNAQAEAERAGE